MEALSPVLIAYDGSESARHAIEQAAPFLAGRAAIVLHAREPVEFAALNRGAIGLSATAAEGAALARQLGLDAEPRTATAPAPVADTIVGVADEIDAALVILGSRGHRSLRSLMLGSVSHAVVHHANRPVLVIPAPALATARREFARAVADRSPVLA